MKYYAVISKLVDEKANVEYRPDHLAYLEALKSEGKTFAFGRFADGAGGMIIYVAENFEEAKSYADNDPYVLKKARTYEIHEWEMKQ